MDCLTFQPSDWRRASTLCSESPTIKRSFAEETAVSKSAFSSGPKRSSNDALALRRRLVFLGAPAVLRVLRAGTDGAELRDVLRVLRTGLSSVVVVGAAVRRVFRAGLAGTELDFWTGLSLGLGLGRIPGFELPGDRVGPLGRNDPGGTAVLGPVDCVEGGPRLLVGGP